MPQVEAEEFVLLLGVAHVEFVGAHNEGLASDAEELGFHRILHLYAAIWRHCLVWRIQKDLTESSLLLKVNPDSARGERRFR